MGGCEEEKESQISTINSPPATDIVRCEEPICVSCSLQNATLFHELGGVKQPNSIPIASGPWNKMADHRHPNAAVSPESSPTSESESGGHYNNGLQDSIREQDRFLPIANVGRIMKRALPGNAKISKDAKETVQECVSEFISFITGEASDKCQREKRKTINGDDLLWGMTTLGFEDYVEPLKIYLHKYRELEGERSYVARQGEQHQRQLKESPTASHGSGNDPSGPNRRASYAYSPHGPMLYDPQHRPLAMAYHMAVQAPGAGSGAGPADRGR